MRAFYAECERVAYRLLEAISLALEIEPGILRAHFEPEHTSFLRLNTYPICDDPAANLGISPHTDAGAVTVLLQDEHAGLEVARGGGWFAVEPNPDALVINIGDVVQVWSNDRYAAPLHRVKASASHERYSAPFFLNPAYHADYRPLIGEPHYRPINWGAFRAGRAAGDYADVGREIQISDFRI